jgi:hypothetical protein
MEHANLSCEGGPENSKHIVAPPRGRACWPAHEALTANYAAGRPARPGLRGHGGGARDRRSGPARAGYAPAAFPIVNRFSMARMYGRTGRITAQNGGFRPG